MGQAPGQGFLLFECMVRWHRDAFMKGVAAAFGKTAALEDV